MPRARRRTLAKAKAEPLASPTYIGIDPGAKGGITYLSYHEGKPWSLIYPIPDTREILLRRLRAIPRPCFCVLEKVWARPGQGAGGMWKFGVGYGCLLMGLTAASIPFEEVAPVVWMKKMGIAPRVTKGRGAETPAQFKRRLQAIAQQTFPHDPFAREVKLDLADSVLIAEFCRRLKMGELG